MSRSSPRPAPTFARSAWAKAALTASAIIGTALGGCANPPSGADDTGSPGQGIVAGSLEAKVDRAAQSVTLRNTTGFEVGYMVVEKDMNTIALFPPCGTNCPIIVQGATATVRYADISGYTPQAREARVMWWTYRRNTDGSRTAQGGVNTVSITL